MPSTNKLEAINHLKKDRMMDGYILTTGFEFSEEPMAHEGQELLFILESKQDFIYNGKRYLLEQGDCCCFDANVPHYGRSLGKKESKALIVFSMQPKN
jgi:mannose-6-phosphate isomerase-like protein (cupin superfamily)